MIRGMSKKFAPFALCLAALLQAGRLPAGEGDAGATGVHASVSLEKRELKLGEPLRMVVKIAPGRFSVELPDLPPSWGTCEVLSQTQAESVLEPAASAPGASGGNTPNASQPVKIIKREFSLTSYEVGQIAPPAYRLRRFSPDSGWTMQSVAVPVFEVKSSLPPESAPDKGDGGSTMDIAELSQPLELAAPWRLWLIAVVVAAAGLAAALAYWLMKRRPRAQAALPPPPPPAPRPPATPPSAPRPDPPRPEAPFPPSLQPCW